MAVTAKVKLASKTVFSEGTEYEQVQLNFMADYADGRNAEWAVATPALSLAMTVKPDVAERFEEQGAYTLTFEAE